jgi:hypothetical protein
VREIEQTATYFILSQLVSRDEANGRIVQKALKYTPANPEFRDGFDIGR